MGVGEEGVAVRESDDDEERDLVMKKDLVVKGPKRSINKFWDPNENNK